MAIPLRSPVLLLFSIALPARGVQFPGAALSSAPPASSRGALVADDAEYQAEYQKTLEEAREVAEETEREADRLLQKEEVELPTEPGCFLRTPSGCPNHPSFGSTLWRHDDYAETFSNARELRRECEMSRKERMAQWCGSEDVEMMFIPSGSGASPAASTGVTSMMHKEVPTEPGEAEEPAPAPAPPTEELVAAPAPPTEELGPEPAPPTEPGCYFRKPKGCPSHPQFSGKTWKHAEHAERLINAKGNRTACEVEVRSNLVDWCGTETVEVLFVARFDANGQLLDLSDDEGDDEGDEEENDTWVEAPTAVGPSAVVAGQNGTSEIDRQTQAAAHPEARLEAPPTEPGCYVRKLKGCPKHPQFNGTVWRHAANAEKTTQARLNRTACEVGVKASMTQYCGTEEVEVMFIPALPEPESSPRSAAGEAERDQAEKEQDARDSPDSTHGGGMPGEANVEQQQAAQGDQAAGGEESRAARQVRKEVAVDEGTKESDAEGDAEQQQVGQPDQQGSAVEEGNQDSDTQGRGESEPQKVEQVAVEGTDDEEADAKTDGTEERRGAGAPGDESTLQGDAKQQQIGQPDQQGSAEEEGNQDSDTQGRGEAESQKAEQVEEAAAGNVEETDSGEEKREARAPGDAEQQQAGQPDQQGIVVEEGNQESDIQGRGEAEPQEAEQVEQVEKSAASNVEETDGGEEKREASAPGDAEQRQNGQADQQGIAVEEGNQEPQKAEQEAAAGNAEEADGGDETGEATAPGNVEEHERALQGEAEQQQAGQPDQQRSAVDEGNQESDSQSSGQAETQEAEQVAVEETGAEEKREASAPDAAGIVERRRAEEELVVPFVARQQASFTEPGCFVRTPSGCPNHPSFGSVDWKHDEYAERYSSSGKDRTECEVSRKVYVEQWCGAEDVETLFVPGRGGPHPASRGSLVVSSEAKAPPTEPGCFVRTPSGCPNHPSYHSSEWKHEEHSERFTKARANRTMCEVERKAHVAHWCGVPDVELVFVPPPGPGCYVSTPSGCPRHPSFSSTSWRHEEYGEAHTGAKENRTECEIVRRAHVASWCNTADVRMRFVPPDWGNLIGVDGRFHEHSRLGAPPEPGCFVRMLTGCPNHPTFNSTQWKHEEFGEHSAEAKVNRTACEVDRKRHVAHWCGTEAVEMLFVAPPEPGCYVRTPSGCPNHPHFSSSLWKHEDFGESSLQAGTSRTACEVERRKHLVHWCGAADAEMLFVPKASS